MRGGKTPRQNQGEQDVQAEDKGDHTNLPAPVALTPEQLKEMAAMTAGGLTSSPAALITRAGPYPPMRLPEVGAQNVSGQ